MPKHPSLRHSLVASQMPALRERFKSAGQALEYLRSIGQGIRRQDFLDMWRAGASAWRAATGIRYVRRDYVPGARAYGERYFGRPARYTYLVRTTEVDAGTGERRERYSYLHTDYRGTRRGIEQHLMAAVNETLGRKGSERWTAIEIKLDKAWRNPLALPE